MSICDTPNAIATIDLDDCIGTSLITINTNFLKLKEQACEDNTELSILRQELIALSASYLELSAKSPGVPKAWATFNGQTGSIYSSLNISQISSEGTGKYAVIFGTAFPSLCYTLVGTSSMMSATPFYTWLQPTTAFTPASAIINVHDLSGTFVNPEYISIAVYNK